MCAVAPTNQAFVPSEFQVLRSISNLTWQADSPDLALAAIEELIWRIPGITGFRFECPNGSILHAHASAVAQVGANGKNYGQVRIMFDPQARLGLESPVRFCRFLGQQLGLMFHRVDLQRQRQGHYFRLNALARSIRRSKSVRHASAVLARQLGISPADATVLLVRYARQNRKRLLDVSDSLTISTNFPNTAQTYVR